VTYACPVCGNDLSEHGTAGMTCMYGHHFLATDIKGRGGEVRRVRGREFRVPAWVPGAVLGGWRCWSIVRRDLGGGELVG
jgi:DNA-directed RNA polymerase subunit RPC12/RpoP